MKGNSKVHNQDCEDFVDWYIDTAKANGCETGIFCGDWNHNRNSLNLTTMDSGIRALEKLGTAFDKFYMFAGNHDLYFKDKRDIKSTEFARHIPGITVIEEMTQVDEYVFTGHFHKRQNQKNVHYIGNAFPHNYADVWDDDRGMMILDRKNNAEPEYINWTNCPKYRTVKLSQLIDDKDTLIKDKMYLRVTLDLPISFEEATFIKETFMTEYSCREITLIPQKNLEEINTDLDIAQFESVDQIVSNEILAIDSQNFDKTLLLNIYSGLEQ